MTSVICPCRVGNTWDKQHGVAVERKRLLQHTQELVARGLQAGTFWHTAQNAEHARPMLQVSDLLIEQGLLILLLETGGRVTSVWSKSGTSAQLLQT